MNIAVCRRIVMAAMLQNFMVCVVCQREERQVSGSNKVLMYLCGWVEDGRSLGLFIIFIHGQAMQFVKRGFSRAGDAVHRLNQGSNIIQTASEISTGTWDRHWLKSYICSHKVLTGRSKK